MPSRRFVRALPYAIVGTAAGFLYYVAANIRYSERAGTLGPDFWPRLILTLILAACAYEIVKILFTRAAGEVAGVLDTLVEASPQDAAAGPPPRLHPGMLAGGIALTGAYVALVQTLGFFTATVPYIALFLVVGGYRRARVIAAVSIVGALLMLFFFMKVVYVSLPLGVPPFQQVTLMLMQLFGIR